MKIEQRPVDSIKPYDRNPRRNDKAVDAVAASIREFGFQQPIVVDGDGVIVVGHTRWAAAKKLKLESVPVHVADELTDEKARAYRIADNKTGDIATWDDDLLRSELEQLNAIDYDVGDLGFTDDELAILLASPEQPNEEAAPIPEAAPRRAELGDVWLLGRHRIICGDSTDPDVVARVCGDLADIHTLHADPPYGMGKEGEGIANDNLYREKLDAFQMAWWRACRPVLADNASVYIWGQPVDLFRLWLNGLEGSERMTYRNEITWDKGTGMGMRSAAHRMFATATERCLFFMLGEQGFGNVNTADYWEGYEPLRLWMVEQRDLAGWTNKRVNEITGTHMAGHWFTKSQFEIINEPRYLQLQEAAAAQGVDAFQVDYAEIGGDQNVRSGGNKHKRSLLEQFRETRAFFDNTHDTMTDVWTYGRVLGEDRFGHATPKPLEMIERCVKSSCPKGGVVLEPFLGTGTTLIACERTGRSCVGLELEPTYVDIVVERWEQETGESAEKAAAPPTKGRRGARKKKAC